MTYEILINGQTYRVELLAGDASPAGQHWVCRIVSREGGGRELRVDCAHSEADVLSLLVGGHSFEAERERFTGGEEAAVRIALRGRSFTAEVRDPRALRSRRARAAPAAGPRKLLAPMPGKVIRVLAPAGATVQANQGVLVIEAMKMQNEIKSPQAGTVQKLLVAEGAAVNAGDVLAVVE